MISKECKIRTNSQLNSGEKEHVRIAHDDSSFYSYDGPHAVWRPKGERQLGKKVKDRVFTSQIF